MNKFTQKWTIISLLETVPLGLEFSYKNWPEHITLADIFTISWPSNYPHKSLHNLASQQEPINLQPEHSDYFGPKDYSVPVIIYKNSDSLTLLHFNIIDLLLQQGAVFDNPSYIKQGFIAHRTLSSHTNIPIDQTVTLGNLAIIDMFPGADGYKRKIHALFTFK